MKHIVVIEIKSISAKAEKLAEYTSKTTWTIQNIVGVKVYHVLNSAHSLKLIRHGMDGRIVDVYEGLEIN